MAHTKCRPHYSIGESLGNNEKGNGEHRLRTCIPLSLLPDLPRYEQAASSSCCYAFTFKTDYTFKLWVKHRPCFPLSCSCQVFHHRQQRQKVLMQYLYWSDLRLVHSTSRRWIQSSLNYMYLKWGLWFLINNLNWRFWSRKAKTQAKKILILLDFSSLSSILLLATTLQSTNALQSKVKFPSENLSEFCLYISDNICPASVIRNSSNWNCTIIPSKNIKSC